ncbi:MAG: polysaccharide deacetylase family protein [Gammaproteobacteria bacterium]|nr:polysaccharide deacetylase family protein [Gammaproteobacteria bacterium]
MSANETALAERLGRRNLPILCYHRVLAAPPPGGTSNIHVTREVFAAHLRQLRRRGLATITFADLAGERPVPKRPVILSFDDGYRDNYEHLLPLLDQYDARAVIFALGDRNLRSNRWDEGSGMPQAPLMSDAELRACASSGRMEIGCHGLAHRHLRDLDDGALEEELRAGKASLEAVTGRPVISFAYPWGEWSRREREAVARAGYLFGVATDHGTTIAEDRYTLARRIVFPRTSGFGFYKKTSPWYRRYRRVLGRS